MCVVVFFFGEGWPTTILSFIATCTIFSWRPSRYANPALYVLLLLLLLLKRVCALNTDFFPPPTCWVLFQFSPFLPCLNVSGAGSTFAATWWWLWWRRHLAAVVYVVRVCVGLSHNTFFFSSTLSSGPQLVCCLFVGRRWVRVGFSEEKTIPSIYLWRS